MLVWFHLLQKDSSIENVIPYRFTLPYAWFLLLKKIKRFGKNKNQNKPKRRRRSYTVFRLLLLLICVHVCVCVSDVAFLLAAAFNVCVCVSEWSWSWSKTELTQRHVCANWYTKTNIVKCSRIEDTFYCSLWCCCCCLFVCLQNACCWCECKPSVSVSQCAAVGVIHSHLLCSAPWFFVCLSVWVLCDSVCKCEFVWS